MSNQNSSKKGVNEGTNKIRDAFGVVSVAGMSILTLYAIANMVPVWRKSLDEDQQTSKTVDP
jgi:hypothetical protein